MTDRGNQAGELERLCCHCNYVHPAEPYSSEYAICLRDPEIEPHLDDILDRQDFSRCGQLVKRKRFDWDREACSDFDPIEDDGSECSPEVAAELENLAVRGELTAEAVEGVLLRDMVNRTNWKGAPVDSHVDQLSRAGAAKQRDPALEHLGWLVAHENRRAFDALGDLLRKQKLPATLSQSHFKRRLLTYLSRSREYRKDLADLLVEDLFRTPSNNHTRGWYTDVFHFFERTAPELAGECLGRILDSPKFSYRIKRRVREIIQWCDEIDALGTR